MFVDSGAQNWTLDGLHASIDARQPVICLIQVYGFVVHNGNK